MRPWWQQFPARWELEQKAMTDTGWEWAVDESLTAHGIIGLSVAYPVPAEYRSVLAPAPPSAAVETEGRVWLRVLFPAAYPFFPPAVRDPDHRLRLPRHREPIAGTLCLIDPADWGTGRTAADLLATQLPRMLAAATSTGSLPVGWEVPAGEPVGHSTPDRVGARIIVDSHWNLPPEVTQGRLVVGFTQFANGDLGSGMVRLLGAGGQLLETFPDRLGAQFPVTGLGRWLRWDGFTPAMTAAQVWAAVDPLLRPLVIRIDGSQQTGPVVEVIGILVPSETRYRQPGEEWFFAVRHRRQPDAEWRYELFHSAPGGAADVRARTPTTSGLGDRAVLLVGTGAIGGTVAVELARAGIGRLHLVDGDVIDPATACRQYAPAIFTGYAKPAVLQHLLAETTPYVDVRAHCVTLGAVHTPGDEEPDTDPHRRLVRLIGDADLVIDGAADPAVSCYLAALAAVGDTTFLHVSATAGAHGGLVAVIPGRRPGCWWCMLYHRRDHTLPFPPAAPGDTATLVPVGCAEPTFTGTSADLAGVAVHAARVAIDRLTTTPEEQRMRGDLYVAALRDHHGRPIPIRWRTRPIRAHPDCPMRTLHGEEPTITSPPPTRSALGTARGPVSGEGAATAHADPPGTVTTSAAGAPTGKAATACTLRTQQRKQQNPSGGEHSVDRGGAASESSPTGGETPWPPETAPTPAAETPPTSR